MHPAFALGAPQYELRRQQWVPRPLQETFQFFETPTNLARITPGWLAFRIKEMEPNVIRRGTVITYQLRWLCIPYCWRTLIEDWVLDSHFVDRQLNGPYILWRHTHSFESCAGGVLVCDRVDYRLPFGPLGSLIHRLVVRRQLQAIFDYRAQRIAQFFSSGVVHNAPPNYPARDQES